MTARRTITGAALLLALTVSSSASAQVLNGSFEQGIQAFATLGDVQVSQETAGIRPTDGANQAFLFSAGFPVNFIEIFLSAPAGSIARMMPSDPTARTQGSALSLTVRAPAGAMLAFDFNFLTNEFPSPFFNDAAVVVKVGDTLPTLLANTLSALVPAPPGERFLLQSGYRTSTAVIPMPASGIQRVGFAVLDAGDTIFPSGLLIDNIRIVGDLDNDGDVDNDDLILLLTNRGSTPPLRNADLDRDGKITVLDGRKLTLLCTRPNCAIR
jgi:hypothetical protein